MVLQIYLEKCENKCVHFMCVRGIKQIFKIRITKKPPLFPSRLLVHG